MPAVTTGLFSWRINTKLLTAALAPLLQCGEMLNANCSCCFVGLQGSNVVEDQDLLEIGILNSAHRQRLLQAIRLLPRVSIHIQQTLKTPSV